MTDTSSDACSPQAITLTLLLYMSMGNDLGVLRLGGEVLGMSGIDALKDI